MIYKRITKPTVKLRLRRTAPIAIALHRQMYTAFAELVFLPPVGVTKWSTNKNRGDVRTLRNICAEGILENFRKRIAARGGEKWDWTLHDYTSTPRVVSNRAAQLPIDKAGFRQAVVKIESRQSLTRIAKDGTRVPGTGNEKVVREYVVIQRQMFEGKEGEWLVWGTTEETTPSKLAAEEQEDL